MKSSNPGGDASAKALWGTLVPLLFGLAVLAFLTVIERQSWFHIRPAPGASTMLTSTSDGPARDLARSERTR